MTADAATLDLPSLPLQQRTSLPDCAAVYFALCEDDTVLIEQQTAR